MPVSFPTSPSSFPTLLASVTIIHPHSEINTCVWYCASSTPFHRSFSLGVSLSCHYLPLLTAQAQVYFLWSLSLFCLSVYILLGKDLSRPRLEAPRSTVPNGFLFLTRLTPKLAGPSQSFTDLTFVSFPNFFKFLTLFYPFRTN